MNKKIKKRWAWVLTGSGHFFTETINLINTLEKVDLFISKAAEEVLVMYKKKAKCQRALKFTKIILLARHLLEIFTREHIILLLWLLHLVTQ